MNIITTQFDLNHKALEIYLAGCKGPHCKGCHNPESWNFNSGTDYKLEIDAINQKLDYFDLMIENIFLMGGDPMDQNFDELYDLLKHLASHGMKIWMFTRYPLEDIPIKILSFCDYVKSGRYDQSCLSNKYIQYGVELASTNQIIYKKGDY